jgi:hypothetical protein
VSNISFFLYDVSNYFAFIKADPGHLVLIVQS